MNRHDFSGLRQGCGWRDRGDVRAQGWNFFGEGGGRIWYQVVWLSRGKVVWGEG